MEPDQTKGTILIVDDEPDVVFFISKICRPQGYNTMTAGSGKEALKYIEELGTKIDLVLLDLKMPGMGGMEVLKAIRQRHEHLPVIVLTALAEKKAACEQLEVEAFVTKPYSLEDLYRQMTAVTGRIREEKVTPEAPPGHVPAAKILIVDDEEEVCEFLSEYLAGDTRRARHQIRFVTSGDEALRIANEFEPDIAIVDIKMPYMWGDELIERFQRGESFCPKDFIIFTAADMPEQRRRAKKSGHPYLTKPNQFEKLSGVVEKICVRKQLFKKT